VVVIFWDIMSCSLLKVNRRFRRTSPPSSGWKKAPLAASFHVGFMLDLFFDPEDGGDVPPKRRLSFNGLHSVIFKKIVHLIHHQYFALYNLQL
jgi:hypothetical protein